MGIAKRGIHCLAGIYLNGSELNVKIFVKCLRSVPDKITETKRPPEYRLTNWQMFLCGQLQSPRPDVMPDRREGIARAEGFVAARIETSAS